MREKLNEMETTEIVGSVMLKLEYNFRISTWLLEQNFLISTWPLSITFNKLQNNSF